MEHRENALSEYARAMGKRGARNKWAKLTPEQRAAEGKRGWDSRRKRARLRARIKPQ